MLEVLIDFVACVYLKDVVYSMPGRIYAGKRQVYCPLTST